MYVVCIHNRWTFSLTLVMNPDCRPSIAGEPPIDTPTNEPHESYFLFKEAWYTPKNSWCCCTIIRRITKHILFFMAAWHKTKHTSSWEHCEISVILSQRLKKTQWESISWSRIGSLISWNKASIVWSFDSEVWESLFTQSFSRTSSAAWSRLGCMRDSLKKIKSPSF